MVTGKITLRDVAEEAGVHTSTASRALNPQTRSVVNPETVERVLAVAERLGYRPHPLARGLRTNQTLTVGMVIPDVENPLFGPVIAGVEKRLHAEGYSLFIANTEPLDATNPDVIDALAERRVDGMILATALRADTDVRHLVEQGIPVVLVNRAVEGMDVPSVVNDDHIGMELVVRHLLELGHRDIGHVAGPQTLSTGLGRRRAFEEWTAALGIENAPVEEAEWFRMGPGYDAATRLLAGHPELTAIVAANDLLALGGYQAIREAGYEVGKGISITGYNDVPFMQFMQPPMTAVTVPYRQMGEDAADALLQILSGGEQPGSVKLAPSLSVRESSAPPRL